MSYILDALKRADAERERGAVPGLHTSPVVTPSVQTSAATRKHLGITLAAALVLGAVAAGLWVWHAPAPTPALAAREPAAMPAVMPLTPAAPAPAPRPPAPIVAPATLPAGPVPAQAAAIAKVTAAPPSPPPTKAPAPTVTATPAPTATPAIPLLADLPEEMRHQLPKLTITGAVYSNDPSQRLLLINNQVFTQGASVAPGLSLEDIQPHSAVLSFLGTRFRMTH